MSVKIRMSRIGRKNRPYFRIAVFDTRTRRDGRYLEKIGFYDPVQQETEKKVTLKKDRLEHWLSNGAKMTEAVERLLKHTGNIN